MDPGLLFLPDTCLETAVDFVNHGLVLRKADLTGDIDISWNGLIVLSSHIYIDQYGFQSESPEQCEGGCRKSQGKHGW